MKELIDTCRKAIPIHPAAGIGVTTLLALLAGFVWSDVFQRGAKLWLKVPEEQLLVLQLVLSLCIACLGTLLALVAVIRENRRLAALHAQQIEQLKMEHAAQLESLAKSPEPAGVQGVGSAPISRRIISRGIRL